MPQTDRQILSAAQMRAAEDALIAGGTSVDELMQRAGRGAAEYVWRMAAMGAVTVLCGPGNNGGDGYVIAEALREWGSEVRLIAACPPKTDAALNAAALYQGEVLPPQADSHGNVLVDCLFGCGLSRPLSDEHAGLLARLARHHKHTVAIDLPSGVESDSGAMLTPSLPQFDLTIALGAWKFAHFLMPASAMMGALRLVGIGVEAVVGVAEVLSRPMFTAPAADAHKYRRGLLAVVGGVMPGAAMLACTAAQGAGAGYVRLLADTDFPAPPDLVVDSAALRVSAADPRISAILIGPGLGRDETAAQRLMTALGCDVPVLVDADALHVLAAIRITGGAAPIIATPHDGEFAALERSMRLTPGGTKVERTRALAQASGMVIVAKGADTVIAAPDGRLVCAPRGSSWLSTAGTGDVLAGAIASRLATGAEAFAAACQGVWLHSQAARLSAPVFTASQLARNIQSAYAAAL